MTEAVLMMADPGFISGIAVLVIQNIAYRLVFSVLSNCSKLISAIEDFDC